jgi:hypothetical protein
MLSIEDFKKMCGLEKIKLFKGAGRAFGTTPIGKVFCADKLDWSKDVFVIEGNGTTKKGDSLKGTFWFVNAGATLFKEV